MIDIEFEGKDVDTGETRRGYYSVREGEHLIGFDETIEGFTTYEAYLVDGESVRISRFVMKGAK